MNLRWNHKLLLYTKEVINQTSIQLENKGKCLPSPDLSSVPGAKDLIYSLMMFLKLSIFIYLIINRY